MTGSLTAPHSSDSAEQRAAERTIVAAVAERSRSGSSRGAFEPDLGI